MTTSKPVTAAVSVATRPTHLQVLATALIALSAVLTAWCAFQSAKWNGIQANATRTASAAGTSAARFTTLASSQRTIDVETFLQWLQAARDDVSAGRIDPAQPYVPDPSTLSGFIALRFRDEFKPAFDAWLKQQPFINPNAAGTPFQLPEYTLAADGAVDSFNAQAKAGFDSAGVATKWAGNYVQLTVLFAITLVMTNIAVQSRRMGLSVLVLGLAVIAFVPALILLVTYPSRL